MQRARTNSFTSVISRLTALGLLTLLLVAFQPGEANACSCAPVETGEMVERAQFVFVGQEVVRETTNNPWPSVAVTFEVIEAYKGEVGSEITVWTGGGDADCGVAPQRGLVGIAAYTDGGRAFIDICGSVHSPEAIAAVADPIDIIETAAPSQPADSGGNAWIWLGAGGAVAFIGGLLVLSRRRRDHYQDGWNSGA